MTPSALLALFALAFVVYTYIGYPVLIGILARLAPIRTSPDASWEPVVTSCTPVYDAESYVRAKLESLAALDYPPDKLEFLIYSDGSTDGTDALVEKLASSDPRIRFIRAKERRGKPTAVNAMRKSARGEVLLMTDIRQLLVPGALRALLRALADPRVACVSGNLVLQGAAGAGAYWRYETWIRRQEARFRGMVGVTGPIYAIRKNDLAELPEDVILDDMWVPMRLRLEGRTLLFAEDAVATDDAFGDDREFGRKVRTLAGNYQLFGLLPGLLSPLSPSWFEIASHKVARLMCPWALVVLAVTSTLSAALEPGRLRPVMIALAAGQALFYLGSLLGSSAGKLGTLARTFVVLNAAAVVGLWRTLRGTQRVTW